MKLGGKYDVVDADADQIRFILDTEGIEIVLHREGSTYVDDEEGGVVDSGGERDLAPQIFAFSDVQASRRILNDFDMNVSLRSEHALIGAPDVDIRKNDTFTLDGKPYKVGYVSPIRNTWTIARVYLDANP